MKKLLLLLFFISGLKNYGQTILESYPGATPSIYQTSNYINLNNKMYYFGRTSGYQWSLYTTDGLATGNVVVKNLALQLANIIPQDIDARYNDYKAVFDNKLYFTATNQLWQSDGTTSGTITILPTYSDPKYYKIFDSKLYFTAVNSVGGREVWSTDGTVSGTTMLKDIYPGINPSIDSQFDPHFTVFNNKLFFVANDGITGFELWSTDGTTTGTALFKDIKLTESEANIYDNGAFKIVSNYSAVNFQVYNNKMYFCANTDYTYQIGGFKLFETDGTPSGTNFISPAIDYANCNCSAGVPNMVFASNLTVTPNGLLFAGSPLYTTLGFTSGSRISKIDSVGQLTGLSSVLPYSGDSGSGSDTEQGCFKLFNGEYYFIAGIELYKLNINTNTVTQVSQPASLSYILFNTNNGYSKLLLAQEWNGKLYFVKADGSNGAIFSTDGTLAGTTQVSRSAANQQVTSSPMATLYKSPTSFGVLGSGLYFGGTSTSGAQPSLQRFFNSNLLNADFKYSNISIYPNPTASKINLSFENNLENATLKIASIFGQIVFEKQNLSGNNLIFDLTDLASGMYVVTINDKNLITNTKFIKE